MNIWIYGYKERNWNSKVSYFHYVEHAKLEAACMERAILKYEAMSPIYALYSLLWTDNLFSSGSRGALGACASRP